MSVAALDIFINLMNKYGVEREPFMFIIDFDMIRPEIHKLNSVPPGIKFITPLLSNVHPGQIYTKPVSFKKHPVPFSEYSEAFRNVQKNISMGNSYLLNLTFPTVIETDLTLKKIFFSGIAKYKLLYYNKFVVFSPEIFVRISNGEIKSFPMKGTIDASVNNAENLILNDEKEMAEHNTIVDLIRNDLSIFANDVRVNRFRYIDEIETEDTVLLQVSSEIRGRLGKGYESHLGDIIMSMLPAGSVTGAPKKETVRIIKESETYERGWYTGIFGVFDGNSLDSAVLIRFIENESGRFIYKSGGGITYLSDPVKEYEELISKVYVPAG
ncbi:MAG: aminodeoxychorismate synthase component I [Bacteroidia bacterium]|nr:aminodeoxychorismate synthase component I [Bacteroidia bacterium]